MLLWGGFCAFVRAKLKSVKSAHESECHGHAVTIVQRTALALGTQGMVFSRSVLIGFSSVCFRIKCCLF